MTENKVQFANRGEANAFASAVAWMNPSNVSLKLATLASDGTVELIYEDDQGPNDAITIEPTNLAVVAEQVCYLTEGKIKAECWSDDHRIEVRFDAAAFFIQASEQQIIRIAKDGWGANYSTDEIPRFYERKNLGIGRMFDYIRIVNDTCVGDKVGFGCRVDAEDAIKWLQKYRIDVAHNLKFIEAVADNYCEQ